MNRSSYKNKQTIISGLCCWGIPIFLAFFYLCLAAEPDLRLAVPLLTAITALQVILIAAVVYLGERDLIHWSPWVIIVLAALFRLLFLFKEPQLSDDIYRYLWDGLQSLAGNNPYTMQPDIAPAFTDSMALLRDKINHPDLVTIYPPASQVIFTAGTILGKNLLGIKTLIVLLDLATCFLIMRLLPVLKIKPYRAVLYAWHPLPVIEIAASGHVDGAGYLFLLSAILLLYGQPLSGFTLKRDSGPDLSFIPFMFSGFLFSFCVLIKYFPLVFFPVLILPGRLRNKASFLTGFFTGIFLLSVPYLPDLKNSFSTLNTYLYNWEFAGFAFRVLREMTDTPEMPRKILLVLFCTISVLLYLRLFHDAWHGLKFPQKPVPLLNILDTCYMICFTFLLLTPTLHPWYALGLICFLPFTAGPAGLVFSWSVFLGYRVLIPYTILGQWSENTTTAFMIWAAPVFTLTAVYLSRGAKILFPVKHIDQGKGAGPSR